MSEQAPRDELGLSHLDIRAGRRSDPRHVHYPKRSSSTGSVVQVRLGRDISLARGDGTTCCCGCVRRIAGLVVALEPASPSSDTVPAAVSRQPCASHPPSLTRRIHWAPCTAFIIFGTHPRGGDYNLHALHATEREVVQGAGIEE
jgi:hypothetical protein